MRVKVWSGILIVGLLLTAGCGNQHHTEYGPSNSAMVADRTQANNNIQQPAQMSPVSVPFMAIAGMSPGLVKPIEDGQTQPNTMPTMMAQQQPANAPVMVAGNNLEPLPAQEPAVVPEATTNESSAVEGPVTMTKIDRSANPVGNIKPEMGNQMANSVPLPSQQKLAVAYPAGGMFMYQAGQPAYNQIPQQLQAPQGNQMMTAQSSANPYVDAILKQAANYKRVYSVTSGQYFDPKTNQVFQTIQ